MAPALEEAFRRDKSIAVTGKEGEMFINVFNPTLRLIVVGAVHIAQQLVPMARALGYDVVIVDPRSAFATPKSGLARRETRARMARRGAAQDRA